MEEKTSNENQQQKGKIKVFTEDRQVIQVAGDWQSVVSQMKLDLQPADNTNNTQANNQTSSNKNKG